MGTTTPTTRGMRRMSKFGEVAGKADPLTRPLRSVSWRSPSKEGSSTGAGVASGPLHPYRAVEQIL
jgi:hypothetical protein